MSGAGGPGGRRRSSPVRPESVLKTQSLEQSPSWGVGWGRPLSSVPGLTSETEPLGDPAGERAWAVAWDRLGLNRSLLLPEGPGARLFLSVKTGDPVCLTVWGEARERR